MEKYIRVKNIILYTYREMAERLTREQLKGLSAEEKIAYQKRLNAERVAAYRAANKEKAAEYNKKYKKEYINRPENRDKYKELNKKYVEKYNKQKRQVMAALTLRQANKNAEKLTNNEREAKKAIEEGRAIMQRLNRQKKNKEEAMTTAKDILNDILDVVPNMKIVNGELKPKRGRKIK